VLASVSRVMSAVASPEHAQAAGRLRSLMAKYQELELLIQIGEYRRGADALADQAVARRSAMQQFLAQQPGDRQGFEQTLTALRRLTEGV
jgi:type III secretion protein N (ATPase)